MTSEIFLSVNSEVSVGKSTMSGIVFFATLCFSEVICSRSKFAHVQGVNVKTSIFVHCVDSIEGRDVPSANRKSYTWIGGFVSGTISVVVHFG